jgi:predicted MFS family arabinose efflux permease
VAIGVGVVLLDAGTQATQLANQTVIYGLAPAERSRINAIYMVAYFLGGALGTAVAAQAWQRGGWPAVCAAGGGFAVLAMLPLRRG